MKEHTYKPLPSNLTIKESPIHGLGLFAKDLVPIGFIGMTHIKFKNQIIRTPLGGFINHSDNPNLRFIRLSEDTFGISALRDILPEEELCLDYKEGDQLINCGIIWN